MSDGMMITITLEEYHALLEDSHYLAALEAHVGGEQTAWERFNSDYLVESHDEPNT